MEGVELKPIELWAVVKSHLSGKREIIGTFEDFPSAYIAFQISFTEFSGLYADDVFSIEIVHMIETRNSFDEQDREELNE